MFHCVFRVADLAIMLPAGEGQWIVRTSMRRRRSWLVAAEVVSELGFAARGVGVGESDVVATDFMGAGERVAEDKAVLEEIVS